MGRPLRTWISICLGRIQPRGRVTSGVVAESSTTAGFGGGDRTPGSLGASWCRSLPIDAGQNRLYAALPDTIELLLVALEERSGWIPTDGDRPRSLLRSVLLGAHALRIRFRSHELGLDGCSHRDRRP